VKVTGDHESDVLVAPTVTETKGAMEGTKEAPIKTLLVEESLSKKTDSVSGIAGAPRGASNTTTYMNALTVHVTGIGNTYPHVILVH
jgi:hypothetical protein